MANNTPTLSEMLSSPNQTGEMNESVRAQIQKALAETKLVQNQSSKTKGTKRTPSLNDLYGSPEFAGAMNETVRAQIDKALSETQITTGLPKAEPKKARKKLPKKQKLELSDSLLTVDKSENLALLSNSDSQTFDLKNLAKKAGAGVLNAGSAAFTKMFPTLGKYLNSIQGRIGKQEKEASESNYSTRSYASEIRKSSVFLSAMAEEQTKTVDLLQKILTATNSNAASMVQPGSQTPPVPDINIAGGAGARGTAARTSASRISAGRVAAGVAGAAVVGAVGYAAYNAFSGGNAQQAQAVREERGTFSRTAGAEDTFSIPYSSQQGKYTLGGTEVDRDTYQRARQMMEEQQRGVDRQDPRYQQYVQEGVARQDPMAEERAQERLETERAIELKRFVENARAGRQTATAVSGQQQSTAPGAIDTRILNVKAKEVLVKSNAVSVAPPPSGSTGSTTTGATGGGGASLEGGNTQDNLKFASGVDPRIDNKIASKVKQLEGSFGKSLTITSGFRDATRNASAGGAKNSAHMRGNAVDVQFQGNEQDTIKFVEAASAAGVGGIGVYRPGWVHLDTEAKRVWGPDFTSNSIPNWAQPALQAHMTGRASTPGDASRATEEPTASPVSSTPKPATPAPTAPSSGAAVARASVSDEVATRAEAVHPPPPGDSTAPVTETPSGPKLPGIDPNDPGPIEPADAGLRYARLFNMAA